MTRQISRRSDVAIKMTSSAALVSYKTNNRNEFSLDWLDEETYSMWTGGIINNKNRERETRERGTEGGVISTAHCKRKCWHELKDCRPGEHSCADAPEIEKKSEMEFVRGGIRRRGDSMWQKVKVNYRTTKQQGQWCMKSRARKGEKKKVKSFHTAVHTVKQQ